MTALSAVLILAATLRPDAAPPLSPILCIACGARGGVDAVLNLLLFAPFGVGLSLLGAGWRRAIACSFLLSLLIELTQYTVIPGRHPSASDLVMNSAGGAIGFLVSARAAGWWRPTFGVASALLIGWSTAWLTLQATSSFALTPRLTESRYYGQIARVFADRAPFLGTVVRPAVGGVPIPDRALDDAGAIRDRLTRHAESSVTIVPAGATPTLAPIVRIADAEREEILLIAQRRRDLIFAVRTGGVALRVRPPLFRLAGVLPADAGMRDPMRVAARYGPDAVELLTERRATVRAGRVPLSAALGWTLVMPMQVYLDGSGGERAISWLWLGCLLAPLGYWAARAWRASPPRHATPVIAAGIVVVLIVGLAVVPRAFGLPAATPAEWIAALAGVVGGVATGVSAT